MSTPLDPIVRLERCRMALAEVGVDPLCVSWEPHHGALLFSSDVDSETAWRASQVSLGPTCQPVCFACAMHANYEGFDRARLMASCEAVLPLTADCGVTR